MKDDDGSTMHDDLLVLAGTENFPTTQGEESALAATAKPGPRPWGPWATIGWVLLCLVVITVVQTGVLLAFLAAGVGFSVEDLPEAASNSLILSISTFVSTLVTLGLVAVLIRIRGCSIPDYLALGWPSARQSALAIAGLAALLVISDAVTYLLGRSIVPPFVVDLYNSGWFPMLLLTLVVVAPLGEEILMRGFLYKGIALRWVLLWRCLSRRSSGRRFTSSMICIT